MGALNLLPDDEIPVVDSDRVIGMLTRSNE